MHVDLSVVVDKLVLYLHFILLDEIIGRPLASYILLGLWRKEERVGIPHELRCIEVIFSYIVNFPRQEI